MNCERDWIWDAYDKHSIQFCPCGQFIKVSTFLRCEVRTPTSVLNKAGTSQVSWGQCELLCSITQFQGEEIVAVSVWEDDWRWCRKKCEGIRTPKKAEIICSMSEEGKRSKRKSGVGNQLQRREEKGRKLVSLVVTLKSNSPTKKAAALRAWISVRGVIKELYSYLYQQKFDPDPLLSWIDVFPLS